jgi:hypothetical protein
MKSDEAFQKAKERYLQLREKLAIGKITSQQFTSALRALMVEHNGRYWSLGARNGKWHVYDGNQWIEQEPPVSPDSLPEEQLPMPPLEKPVAAQPASAAAQSDSSLGTDPRQAIRSGNLERRPKSCPKCGVEVPDRARFCRNCGAALSMPPVATPETRPAPESVAPPPLPRPQSGKQTHQSIPFSSGAPSSSRGSIQQEIRPPPVPVGQGIKFVWHRDAKGQLRSGEPPPPTQAGSSQVGVGPGAAAPGTAVLAAFGKEPVNLPPASPVWGFRLQTTAFADKLVKGIVPQNQATPNPFIEWLARIIRGALLDKDVYRSAASNGSLTMEAVWVALALIAISTVGLSVGNLFGYGSSFLFKAMIGRAVGWVAAVVAIHYVAKQWQQVEVPPVAWFRGLIYAQSPTLLSIIPALAGLASIWAAICSVGALQDVSGKDIKVGITLLLVAGLAVTIAAMVIGSLPF